MTGKGESRFSQIGKREAKVLEGIAGSFDEGEPGKAAQTLARLRQAVGKERAP